MAELSRFCGIVIWIFFKDHGVPHLHVKKGGELVVLEIPTGRILVGDMRPKDLRLAREWLALHRRETLEAWKVASAGANPGKIAPLSGKGRRDPDAREAARSRAGGPKPYPLVLLVEKLRAGKARAFFRVRDDVRVKEIVLPTPIRRGARVVHDGVAFDPGDGLPLSGLHLYRLGRFLRPGRR